MNTNDKRYIKNEKLITCEFMQLLSEKGYSETTIAELCEKCLISKTTFYSHYESKDDLLKAAIDGLLENLFNEYEKILGKYSENAIESLVAFTDVTFDYVDRNFDKFYTFFLRDYEINFSRRFVQLLKKFPIDLNDIQRNRTEAGILVDFLDYGSVAAISNWVLSKRRLNLEEIKKLMNPSQSVVAQQIIKYYLEENLQRN